MLLHELHRSNGYKNPKKRLGRGNGSGKGNYSTKGLKGQRARSGGAKPIWFEWGQTPLTRRLPKLKWFKRYYKLVTNYQIVNVSDLNSFRAGSVINKEKLAEAGLIRNSEEAVKILGNGDLEKKFKFEAIDAFSASAKEKIEKAGGEIVEQSK